MNSVTRPGGDRGAGSFDSPGDSTAKERVATYHDYAGAQRAVDALSDQGFPVQKVQVVARDLRLVEYVTGRRTTWTAALEGAASGAAIGALIGFVLGLFSLVDPLVAGWILGLWGLVAGGVLGAVLGAVGHWLTGGRRDFDSRSAFEAGSYDLLVDADAADEARRLLGSSGAPVAG